jgi:ABC-2 type transport system ATP-binding protein
MIQVENLTKYYHDFCAVDRISFDIAQGEILGLLGPNGAGKTTTLRMLTGFLQPTSGSISVKGQPIGEQSLEIKKMLGYLPESAPLYQDMLVYDYLDFVAAIRKISGSHRQQGIRRLADLCGINEVMHQPIGELSKGYKQRVGLAHAMMSDPEILILDEPTSGLDPNQIAEIRQIIKRIGRQKTIILSTHILSEAEATCDRVMIIHRGKIVADGSTDGLKASSGDQKIIHLCLQNADFKSVDETLSTIEAVTAVVRDENSDTGLGVRLECSPSADVRADIYHKIKQTDWILLEFHQQSQSLETVFHELTLEGD